MTAVRRVGRTQYAILLGLADNPGEALTVREALAPVLDGVRPIAAVRTLGRLVATGYVDHVCEAAGVAAHRDPELTGVCLVRITEQGLDARKERDRRPYNRRPAREYAS